jgi:hypothetical protein
LSLPAVDPVVEASHDLSGSVPGAIAGIEASHAASESVPVVG